MGEAVGVFEEPGEALKVAEGESGKYALRSFGVLWDFRKEDGVEDGVLREEGLEGECVGESGLMDLRLDGGLAKGVRGMVVSERRELRVGCSLSDRG